MVFLVILVYLAIAYITVPKLIKKKYWRELAAFGVFYSIALVLSLLFVLGVKIPSPMPATIYFIEEVLHLKYSP